MRSSSASRYEGAQACNPGGGGGSQDIYINIILCVPCDDAHAGSAASGQASLA